MISTIKTRSSTCCFNCNEWKIYKKIIGQIMINSKGKTRKVKPKRSAFRSINNKGNCILHEKSTMGYMYCNKHRGNNHE